MTALAKRARAGVVCHDLRHLDVVRDHEHARWEQAFSYDDRTWKTNWTADFERSAAAKTWAGGRPRR